MVWVVKEIANFFILSYCNLPNVKYKMLYQCLMHSFILTLGAENYKFVRFEPEFIGYFKLLVSCHIGFITDIGLSYGTTTNGTFYWRFTIWNQISLTMKGKRGRENSFEHGFDRIHVFTWRPSLISDALMNNSKFLFCCSGKQSSRKSRV